MPAIVGKPEKPAMPWKHGNVQIGFCEIDGGLKGLGE